MKNTVNQQGTLSFVINGHNYGIAFNDPELKQGELYAGVAINGSGDKCKLLFPQPED